MYSTDQLMTILSQHFDPSQILIDESSLSFYGKDWTTAYKPDPSLIFFPTSTEQIKTIITLANEHHFALVPSGGRTGYSGGAVAASKEVVVSLERMHTIKDINLTDRTMTCDAGCILHTIQETAIDHKLYYPIDIAPKGSCQIGGNVATNAGGNHVIKYGMTRNWIAGMTVITAKGEPLYLQRALIKDNSGYDLKQLFIGSEGTLGIISEVVLRLTQPPVQPQVMLLAINNLENSIDTLTIFQKNIELLAFEFFSEQALNAVIKQHSLEAPFETPSDYYILIEYDNNTSNAEHNALSAFEACIKENYVTDGMASQNESQRKAFWRYRELISESIVHYKPFKCDLSVKPSLIPAFIQAVQNMLLDNYKNYQAIWFGHIGDGNIHLNLLQPEHLTEQQHHDSFDQLGHAIFSIAQQFKGSISAEHGVGLLKKPYLHYTLAPAEINLIKTIKHTMDPNNIMNPYKII